MRHDQPINVLASIAAARLERDVRRINRRAWGMSLLELGMALALACALFVATDWGVAKATTSWRRVRSQTAMAASQCSSRARRKRRMPA